MITKKLEPPGYTAFGMFLSMHLLSKCQWNIGASSSKTNKEQSFQLSTHIIRVLKLPLLNKLEDKLITVCKFGTIGTDLAELGVVIDLQLIQKPHNTNVLSTTHTKPNSERMIHVVSIKPPGPLY